MAGTKLPSTMRAQQVTVCKGGIVKDLQLSDLPLPHRKPDQHLIQVIAAALNPIDYKAIELPLMVRFMLTRPIIPGIDIAGRIVEPADGSSLQPGQLVFGAAGFTPFAGSGLAEYALANPKSIAALPEGIDTVEAAMLCVAGGTAYESLMPWIKDGSRVFINGGSGGTGLFGIQIAKAVGCHVTVTCSTANVEFCRSLGADEVIDYRKSDILATLRASERKYDHVVDNVGSDLSLWLTMHEFTTPDAAYVAVGLEFSLQSIKCIMALKLLPSWLGGGKRPAHVITAELKKEDLAKIAKWVAEGKVKPIVDSTFQLAEAPKAFERMKAKKAQGKIVVVVNAAI